MAVANTIKLYLEKKRIPHEVQEWPPFSSLSDAADTLAPQAVVKTAVLKDELGLLLAVLPAHHSLDLEALSRLLHRPLALASEACIAEVFHDCAPGFVPPLGDAYAVRTILDEGLAVPEALYFAAGDPTHLIRVDGKDFQQLLAHAWLAGGFTRVKRALHGGGAGTEQLADLRQRLNELEQLPALPMMAQRILQLRADPQADAEKLARVVELDPSLAAQVMRYAASPFFAYQGKVDSLRTAISRVLGYEVVMNLALGIATARPFKIPTMGPLGLNPFWRHATYSAALVQALAREMPRELRPTLGLSYLAGLLHNVGHLLLGHLFKREFFLLSDALASRPAVSITALERDLLSVDHTQLGAWLMEAWGLPDEIVVAVREHHDPAYSGVHSTYARLIYIADCMLKGHGMGDGEAVEPPLDALRALGLDELRVLLVMNRVLEGCEGLNLMAQGLAA